MMTALDRHADRVYLHAAELASQFRHTLSKGKAVGVSKIDVGTNVSDEVHDEHLDRVLLTAAAMPVALEMLTLATGRAVEMVFPVDVHGEPGFGIRYREVEA